MSRAAACIVLLMMSLFRAGTLFASDHRSAKGIELWMEDEWTSVRRGSYAPLRLRVQNSNPEPVTLTFRVASDGSGHYLRLCETGVSLEAGQSARLTLPVPRYSYEYQTRLFTLLDGVAVRELTCDVNLPNLRESDRPLSSLVIDTSSPDLRRFEDALNRLYTHPEGNMSFALQPGSLPENWLSYTGLDCIWISLEALRACTPGVRDSLMQWTRAGGRLALFRSEIEDVGDMELLHLLFGARELPPSVVEMRTSFSSSVWKWFAGHIFLSKADPFARYDDAQWDRTLAMIQAYAKPEFARLEQPQILPLDLQPLQTRVFIFGMLLFIVVIGPLNYFLCWRRKKLWLMLFTTPAISAATTLLMVAYAFFAEGFDTLGSLNSIIILDQSTHQALKVDQSVYYAGMSPRDGLSFKTDTQVCCNFEMSYDTTPDRYYHRYGHREPDRPAEMRWGDMQQLTKGWLPSRTETRFATKRVENLRDRLLLKENGNGGLDVTNGLGAGIVELIVCGENGEYYYFPYGQGEIAGGGSATLQAIGAMPKLTSPGEGWVKKSRLALASGMRPGTYLAMTNGSFGGDYGLDGIQWMQERCEFTVFGYWRGGE